MKLSLENIQTKVGKLKDSWITLPCEDYNLVVIFESPSNMATVVDIDSDKEVVQSTTPLYNTLIVSGSKPFIVFSVHYDHRYITRKFRNYR